MGFNIPDEFTDGDLRICISQLGMFLEESVCPMCSIPVSLGDLLEFKNSSSVLEVSRSQDTQV